jgi:hypothetical protein
MATCTRKVPLDNGASVSLRQLGLGAISRLSCSHAKGGGCS